MSSASKREPWIDRWWPLLVILFGVLFLTFLVSFNPTI
jgi:steroid 5-alpha reductase family enzyme